MRGFAKHAVLMAGKSLGPALLLAAPAVSGNTAQSGNLAPIAGTYSNAASVVTVLVRDGADVVAPYAKSATDALSTFWAEDRVTGTDGSTSVFRSAALTVVSTASGAVAYAGARLSFTNRQAGDGGAYQIAELRVFDTDGNRLTITAISSSKGNGAGTPANMNDSNVATMWQSSSGGACDIWVTFSAPAVIGSFQMSASEGNYSFMPGDMTLSGGDGSSGGIYTLLQTYTKPAGTNGWGYTYRTLKSFAVPATGVGVVLASFTYSPAADSVDYTLTGVTGTAKFRVRDVTNASYPVQVSDWATCAASGTLPATIGGNLRYDFYDTDSPGAASASAEKAVVGIRPSKLGVNVGTTYGKPNYLRDFSMYRDLIDQAVFTDSVNAGLPMGGAHVDRYNRLVAWPSGSTFVRMNVGWYLHADDVGEREWINGGVYTKDNYGSAWTIENIASSGISVNTTVAGPNGGVLITFANTNFDSRYIRISTFVAPMTANSLRRTNDAQPGLLLTDSFIAGLALYNGPLRWMWFGMEGVSSTSMPHPSDGAAWDAYMASFPTWANRRMKGFRPEVMVEASNRSGCDLYPNFPLCAGDDYLTGFGSLLAATLDAGIKVRPSGQNETWNGAAGYVGGLSTSLYLGWAAGYGGNVATRTPVAVVRNTQSDHNVSGAHAAGTILFSYLTGTAWNPGIFQALRDTAPGTALPTGGAGSANADWTCLADATTSGGNGSAAIWRYYGVRLAHICNILKASLGAARLIPTAENWVNQTYTGLDSTDRMRQSLAFPVFAGGPALMDVCDGVWDWNVGHYFADRGLSTTTAPGNAASGATRQAAILAQLEADIVTHIATGQIAKMVAARPLAAALNAETRTVNGQSVRYSPALCSVGGYECCNDHTTVPTAAQGATGDDIALCADLAAVHRSSAYEASFTDALEATFAHGGAHCVFTMGTTRGGYGNDFDIHDAFPFNPVSPVAGREAALVAFSAGL
jgi:hypothetical protein